MKKNWLLFLSVLSLTALIIWFSVINYPKDYLSIVACDVGQGDSFLVTYKDFQILIDGGPNERVLSCLSDYMPFWDNHLEVVVLSHPQKDHFAGLIKVFENYEVKYFMTSGLDSGTKEWQVLKELVGGSSTQVINPESGDKYRFGLIYLDILYPSMEYILASSDFKENLKDKKTGDVLGAYSSKKDPNDFSVVLILSFKDFDALFTGDISPEISDQLARQFAIENNRTVEYIKVPHHGSKNGISKRLLEAVGPEVAVISAGKNNSYNHPHKEILEMLKDKDIRILRTDQMGDVVVESDGVETWIQ